MFRRRRRYAHLRVAIYGPARAGVQVEEAEGRTPDQVRADRFRIGAGMAAWAVHRCPEGREDALSETLKRLASGIASTPEGPLPVGLVPTVGMADAAWFAVVPWREGSASMVEADLEHSRVGPVLVVRDAGGLGARLTPAALATLLMIGEEEDPEGRLMLALGVEGVLAWYREAHRMTPPRDALTFAVAHVRERLENAGRPAPAWLPG